MKTTLKTLEDEFKATKTDLTNRITELEKKAVTLDQLNNILSDSSFSNCNFNPCVNTPSNDQISYLTNMLNSLEKESNKTNISITGYTFTSNDYVSELINFLSSKFGISCSNISLKESLKRIIVNLLDLELKSHILKNKKSILADTKIFINPDRTAKERIIDWHVKAKIKQLVSEGTKFSRKGNRIAKNNLVYSWNDAKNVLVVQLKTFVNRLLLHHSRMRNLENAAFSPPFLANYNIFWSNAIRNHAIRRVSGGLITAINANLNASLLEDSP
ncbi:Protein of unknown function [Cotesia congregata]|uniref:Uncharacterized protein n=1 Tax=Cotesia congregata TaxID=51543 RepID=A0A8J2MPW3_COTCN|nr:Protein of unknown function [Cotesia congregata]